MAIGSQASGSQDPPRYNDIEKVASEDAGNRDAGRKNAGDEEELNEDEKYLEAVKSGEIKEVTWEGGDQDPSNPRSMSKFRKWLIVIIVSVCSLNVTATSSLYTITYGPTIPYFQSSRIILTLGLSLFVAGLGLGPMLLAPLSEFYGRRIIYIVSFAFFTIWLIPCALAKNIQTMLVARFFNGLSGSAFLSVAGGSVGDVFSKKDLSLPMMIFTASPFIGPELGPMIGGFITQFADWRWCYWTLMIWAGTMWACLILFVPETYHPVLLRDKAVALRKKTGDSRYRAKIETLDKSVLKTIAISCKKPFQLLVFEPMCLNLCLLSSILLGIIYLFFGAFGLIFVDGHGFELYQLGLSFIGLLIGMILGVVSNEIIFTPNYQKLVQREEEKTGIPGKSEPEFRLPPTVFGAWIVPVGLFGFAWTTYPHVHWIAPIIFSGVFAIGTVWCFSGIFTFLVECYPLYAASALGANSFARSSFAAAFPLFGVQMYEKLGDQWATSLLAFLALAMAPFPYIFYIHGKNLRSRSRFTSAS